MQSLLKKNVFYLILFDHQFLQLNMGFCIYVDINVPFNGSA